MVTTRTPDTPETFTLPEHQQGIKRLPCVRHHAGPIRPTLAEHNRAMVATRVWKLHQFIAEHAAFLLQPVGAFEHRQIRTIDSNLSQCTTDHDQVLIQAIDEASEDDHTRGTIILAHWAAQYSAETLQATFGPMAAQAFEEITGAISEVAAYREFSTLQRQLESMPWTSEVPLGSSPTAEEANRTPACPRREQSTWVQDMRDMEDKLKMVAAQMPATIPRDPSPPMQLVLHLYSGRRRHFDFQMWAEHYLFERGLVHVKVISLDTAVSENMDVYTRRTWDFLLGAAASGSIRAILCGPPCETWSAARGRKLDGPDARRAPRPLRSRQHPWGVLQRSCREMEQLRVGSTLLIRALWIIIRVVCEGGKSILEHPAPGWDEDSPSIWYIAIMQLIVDKLQLCSTTTIEQWKWGAHGIKPTRFLYSNTDLPRHLATHRDDCAPRPRQALIGKQTDGQFRTSRAKEYASRLNRAFADALCRDMTTPATNSSKPDWQELADEFIAASTIFSHGSWKPDYQPRPV